MKEVRKQNLSFNFHQSIGARDDQMMSAYKPEMA